MGLGRNAAEEFSEEIIYGFSYRYINPWVRKKIDEWIPDTVDDNGRTQPNILKEAAESAINVIVMGVIFLIIRYEEQILDRLFMLARSAKGVILAGGRTAYNALKNKVKLMRGVRATNRFNRAGDDFNSRVGLVRSVDNELSNIVQARQTQYMSTASYGPAAQMHDTAVQKERLYQELGSSKVNAKLQLSMFKLFTASFTETDKQVLKQVFKGIDPNGTFNPAKVDVAQLNKISEFMFIRDSNNKIVGLSRAFIDLLNGLGYVHKSNSGV